MLFPELTERTLGSRVNEFLESLRVVVLSKEKTKNMTELRVRPRGKSSCFGRGLLIHLEFLAVFKFLLCSSKWNF